MTKTVVSYERACKNYGQDKAFQRTAYIDDIAENQFVVIDQQQHKTLTTQNRMCSRC